MKKLLFILPALFILTGCNNVKLSSETETSTDGSVLKTETISISEQTTTENNKTYNYNYILKHNTTYDTNYVDYTDYFEVTKDTEYFNLSKFGYNEYNIYESPNSTDEISKIIKLENGKNIVYAVNDNEYVEVEVYKVSEVNIICNIINEYDFAYTKVNLGTLTEGNALNLSDYQDENFYIPSDKIYGYTKDELFYKSYSGQYEIYVNVKESDIIVYMRDITVNIYTDNIFATSFIYTNKNYYFKVSTGGIKISTELYENYLNYTYYYSSLPDNVFTENMRYSLNTQYTDDEIKETYYNLESLYYIESSDYYKTSDSTRMSIYTQNNNTVNLFFYSNPDMENKSLWYSNIDGLEKTYITDTDNNEYTDNSEYTDDGEW